MMPGRPHHSDKWHSCWEQIQAKGHDAESAAAICTKQLGDESYKSLEDKHAVEGRELHLRVALGKVRTEKYRGKDHLVVPVIALLEGVIQAVNSPIPEFVPGYVATSQLHAWNGRPAVVFHPTKEGHQCSANSPEVLEAHEFGTIFKAGAKGDRLALEAWIDPDRLEALGQKELLADLREGKPVEVSVGAFVQTELKTGEYKGKPYKAIWRSLTPDHLAFLPGKRGACSIDMGCGAHRAAEGATEAQVYEVTEVGFLAAAENIEELRAAAKKYNDCPTCDGMGQVDGKDCPTCEGNGKVKAAEATSGEPHHKSGDTAEGEMTMEKKDIIAALMKCEHNPVKVLKTLEAMDDASLKALQDHCAALAKAKEDDAQAQAEQRAASEKQSEKITALEAEVNRLKTAPTEAEWMKVAPAGIKTLLERQKKQDDEKRGELVETLKTAQDAYTEEELKAMEIPDLEKLVKALKLVEEPKDFSGRETIRQRNLAGKDNVYLNPPNPYAEGIKRMQDKATV